MQLSVVILAAGKGKRMASNVPKVMHHLAGIPLLERVVSTTLELTPHQIHVVCGNGQKIVRNSLLQLAVNWVEQKEQLGTGHAVMQALPHIDKDDRVLVLYGDVPLISSETLQSLLDVTPVNGLGILVAKAFDPTGLGRIIRNEHGKVIEIVEHKDANKKQRQINEINTGIITCSSALLNQWLPTLKPHNQQGEFYLTDIISLAVSHQIPVSDISTTNEIEVQGINDLWQLANLERSYQLQYAKKLALAGVRIIDPHRLDIRGKGVNLGRDTTLDINVILEGPVTIGKNCHIGANCIIKSSTIGDDVTVLPNTLIEGAVISNHCSVGPFARLRPGTILEDECKVGNFVEIKKTQLGKGSKASHLTYLGDAKIGENVNIGAGTITCNYDGVNKWETVIKDGAFIGSNTSIVAPIIVGENATIGAGSTITQDAPDHQLTLARTKQQTISDWTRPARRCETES